MRIRIFLEMEIDEQVLLPQVRQGLPDAQVEHLPAVIAQSVTNLAGAAIPGYQHGASCAIPELQTSSIIKPPSGSRIIGG